MLNNLQIDKVLSRNSATQRRFRGCFAADEIPPPPPRDDFGAQCPYMQTSIYPQCTSMYPYGMVVNTDEAKLPGEHWVAMWVESPSLVEYYDSLADWPPRSPHIAAYLQRFARVRRNTVPLQSQLSSACGKHALYFILKKCQGRSFSAIVNHLNGRLISSTPDRLIHAAIRHHFNL